MENARVCLYFLIMTQKLQSFTNDPVNIQESREVTILDQSKTGILELSVPRIVIEAPSGTEAVLRR